MTQSGGRRVGVVGTGYWGSKHVRTLSSLAEVAQVCVVDPRTDRTESLRRTYPAVTCFPTLDEAMDSVDVPLAPWPRPATSATLSTAASGASTTTASSPASFVRP